MLEFFRRRWFLVSLVVLISAGLTLGSSAPQAFENYSTWVKPRVVTAVVLFLMSFSLNSQQLQASFRRPLPVVWASLMNYGFIPLMAWGLMSLQNTVDFQYGLMIAASVPCTLAAASVWTRKAQGNDAVSLLVTLLTNGFCFLVTPFWLSMATRQGVALDPWAMMLRLVQAVLIPTLAGQGLRLLPSAAGFATKYKTPIGVVAQACILTLVLGAAGRGGLQLSQNSGGMGIGSVALVWGTCIAIHLVAMVVAYQGGGLLGFSRADSVAVSFAGSQKTLPIGVLIATDKTMFGNPELLAGAGIPFAVFPMLMYHASQLFIDTAVADRFAAHNEKVQQQTIEESSENAT